MFVVVYEYEGRECLSGSMPRSAAEKLVDEGRGKAVITADTCPICVYPLNILGENYVPRTAI